MEKMSLGFILTATGGRLSSENYNVRVSGISTDTRTVKERDLFIALKGDNFDGNDYIKTAFEKGAYAAVAETASDDFCRPVITVNDTRAALLALAASYRQNFSIPVVGVTGSVGKTSTKEAIAAVLSQKYLTHKNEGNRNNEIGMPMAVFGLEKKHKAAVFEMGMSGFGEISRLARVASPDIGVITNIGVSHIGKLGSRENILKAKLEIIDGMKKDGVLILNSDNDMLAKYISEAQGKLPIEIETYGIKNHSGIYADNITADAFGSDFTVHFGSKEIRAHMPCAGEHNIYNALAAFAVGLRLNVKPEAIVKGLSSYTPSGMRQKITQINGLTLIEDCYNASPDSMNAGFNVLKTVKKQRGIAVLADMLELGDESKKAHADVGEMAAASGVDILLAYGDFARYYCEGYNKKTQGGESCFFEDKKALEKAILDLARDGDTVLFKGSRGMKLEEVIQAVTEGWKNK